MWFNGTLYRVYGVTESSTTIQSYMYIWLVCWSLVCGEIGYNDTCIWYNRPIAVSCSVSPLYIIVGLHIQILSVCHVLYSTVKGCCKFSACSLVAVLLSSCHPVNVALYGILKSTVNEVMYYMPHFYIHKIGMLSLVQWVGSGSVLLGVYETGRGFLTMVHGIYIV